MKLNWANWAGGRDKDLRWRAAGADGRVYRIYLHTEQPTIQVAGYPVKGPLVTTYDLVAQHRQHPQRFLRVQDAKAAAQQLETAAAQGKGI